MTPDATLDVARLTPSAPVTAAGAAHEYYTTYFQMM